MAVELPKDAEGREILYEVYHYKYPVRRTIQPRKWQVVIMDYIAHDVSDLYLTPPDSWEKLDEDPVCAYAHNIGKKCVECKLRGEGK